VAECKSAASRDRAFLGILADVTPLSVLLDPDTAQRAAFEWISGKDPAQVDPCTYGTVEQRYALASLYFMTESNGWSDNSRWLSGAPECEWDGVTCDRNGRVQNLALCKFGKHLNLYWS